MADETTTQPRIPLKEAVSIIWLAQHDFRAESDYKIFCNAVSGVPWDFTDERFLAQIEELKQRLIPRLELDNEENLKKVAAEVRSNTVSKDELEVMEGGLEEAQGQRGAHHKKAHGFTEGAVNNYIKSLKETRGASVTAEQESAIRNSVAQAVQKSLDTGDASHIKNALSSLTNTPIEIPPEVQESISKALRLSEITEAVLTSDDSVDSGTLMIHCLEHQEIPPELIIQKYGGELEIKKILTLSDAPEVEKEVNALLDTEKNGQSARMAALQKSLEGAQPEVIKLFGEFVDPVKLKAALGEAVDAVTGKYVQEAKAGSVDGRQINITPEKAKKLQLFEQGLTQRNTARQASKIFFNNALMASASAVWEPKIQQAFLVYLETSTVQASVRAPEYFHYAVLAGTDVWNSIIGRSTKAVASNAAKTAGAALLKEGGKKVAEAAGGAALKGAAVATGNPVVMFLAAAGGKIISFVWGGLKALFSFLQFKEIGRGLLQATETPRTKDESLVFTLLIVAGLLVVFFMTFVREVSTTAAIVASKDESAPSENTLAPGRGSPHGDPAADAEYNAAVAKASGVKREKKPLVDWAADPNNAEKIKQLEQNVDTTLLVKSSDPNYTPRISQYPGGSYTHGAANAVDVTAPIQSIVISPVSGTIKYVKNEYPDGTGFAGSSDGGGYGNYIEITTSQGYVLRIAHLAFNSMPTTIGAPVTAGQVIGRSGQTGNSTGPHIHFEYTSWDLNIMDIFNQPSP